MKLLEVLVGELLTVDGLATGTLQSRSISIVSKFVFFLSVKVGRYTDISTGEVTALQHERWDDTVERAALVAEALLTSAESTEVFGGLGDYIIIQLEVDASGFG